MPVVHKLIHKDLAKGTGQCLVCGPVTLYFRMDKGKQRARCAGAVDAHRKGEHGLTPVEAAAMREGQVCRLCGHNEHLVVDHCHVTGRIRDVLCGWCNSGLGFFRDNPKLLREAALYVELHA